MRVIGYAFEADTHCPACTLERFPRIEGARDNEGNDVHPIFSTDEITASVYCGECRDLIAEGPDDYIDA